MIEALLWDVDGTLAETERDGHRVAFNTAFEEWGVPWRWDDAHYGALLRVTGGRQRLLHDLAARPEAPTGPGEREALAHALHRRKNQIYASLVSSGAIPLREGVAALVEEAAARGLRQGIVTTTSRGNVEALLRRHFGVEGPRRFDVIVCGEDVARLKPDPEAYRRALEILRLDPRHAVALEDSPDGATAAGSAGIPVVVTRSAYFSREPAPGALAAGPGLHRREWWTPPPGRPDGREHITLDDLLEWRRNI